MGRSGHEHEWVVVGARHGSLTLNCGTFGGTNAGRESYGLSPD